jgi:hypothetical protein
MNLLVEICICCKYGFILCLHICSTLGYKLVFSKLQSCLLNKVMHDHGPSIQVLKFAQFALARK